MKANEKEINKIISFIEGGHMPDIMNFPNINNKSKDSFNNIIYYDDNGNSPDLLKNSEILEKNTPGAFIVCTNLKSLKLIKEELLQQYKRDKNIIFNLIINSKNIDEIINFIKEDKNFEECIKNICIYQVLKKKYEKIVGIFNNQKDIIDFIKKFSSNDIKPFKINKLIKYEDYLEKFKNIHFQISKYYGNLTVETYKQNLEKIKSLINYENDTRELINKNANKVLEGFLTFDIQKDIESLDKLIIKVYTKNTFYEDLNKWIISTNINMKEPITYFTSRLMYSLNSYAQINKKYFCKDETFLSRGIKIPYSTILQYERAKGKIITFSSFITTSENKKIAMMFSGRGNSKDLYKQRLSFSTMIFIKNKFKNNWISNGIDIQDVSVYRKEIEILFLPFSFFYVIDVKIDIDNYTADIYLETIGKEEILEEKIKIGKEIEYNDKIGIMQIKK